MKLIELHTLQSFPVTCLNRDDLGSPKSCFFGGVERARISSQCLKRAIRLDAAELQPDLFRGQRTRLIIDPLVDRLMKADIEATKAINAAKQVADALATLDEKAEKNGKSKVKTSMFLSPAELDAIAAALGQPIKDGATPRELVKAAAKAVKSVALKDAADIGLFGRMVASDQSLTVEGAAMFGHAISTHKCAADIDFFAAVDDAQSEDESGAAITGHTEFNSAVYYRYSALNVDQLRRNLSALSNDQLRTVTDAFIRATLLSVPSARKNSMNGHTLPSYVLGISRNGQPHQLINAFEKPISARNGIVADSVEALKKHHESMKEIWDLTNNVEVAIPDVNIGTFCTRLLDGMFTK